MTRALRRIGRTMAPAMLPGAILLAASPAPAAVGLAIEVHARLVAPGEPLRCVVTTSEPLARLGGRFLDRDVAFARTASVGHGERWSGWTLVPLDQAPGAQALELRGETADGREALGTYALDVAARDFPEEQLSVAPSYVTPPPEVTARLERERRVLGELYRRRSPDQLEGQRFVRPVPGEATSIFGTRRLYNGEPRSPHPGLDLRAATGTEVRAAGRGIVALAQDLYYSGNTVILDHGGGLFTLYAHLSAIDVAEGDRIDPGQLLGRAGATGRVTGPHLHWGAKVGDLPFDPTALLDPALFR